MLAGLVVDVGQADDLPYGAGGLGPPGPRRPSASTSANNCWATGTTGTTGTSNLLATVFRAGADTLFDFITDRVGSLPGLQAVRTAPPPSTARSSAAAATPPPPKPAPPCAR
ncbi:hypothetical protein ABT298_09845 [Streptomyces sp. NPDC001034]|uniref:hypothetical protein n=1 Tax=Streptomyces sp. NPDC001034 TaxID=3154375 RepID=UPI003326B143